MPPKYSTHQLIDHLLAHPFERKEEEFCHAMETLAELFLYSKGYELPSMPVDSDISDSVMPSVIHTALMGELEMKLLQKTKTKV